MPGFFNSPRLRLKEAIAVLEEWAAKDERVRQQLLDFYALAGEHAKVVTVCQEQLKILGTMKDEGQLEFSKADFQDCLGRAYLAQKKWSEAEPLFKGYQGLKPREFSLGPKDEPRLPESLDRLIEFTSATDKPDEVKKWQAERAKFPMPKPVGPAPAKHGVTGQPWGGPRLTRFPRLDRSTRRHSSSSSLSCDLAMICCWTFAGTVS